MKKITFFLSLLIMSGTVWAGELWVAPAANPADSAIGGWAATNTARTHFSFAVPDDFSSLVSAKVVMIGRNNKDASADVFLSISQEALQHDYYIDAVLDIPISTATGELMAVDVTAIFPVLNAGSDYASLYFDSKFVRVVGLRFTYSSNVAGDLAAETSARIAADAAIQSEFDSESVARAAADEALQAGIDLEVTARGAGDAALQSAIDSEASARSAGDDTLNGALAAESSTRMAADSSFQSALSAEESARIAADSAHASDANAHHTPFAPDVYTVVAYGESIAQCEDDSDIAMGGGTVCHSTPGHTYPTVLTESHPCCTKELAGGGYEIATCGTLPSVKRHSWCSQCSLLTIEYEPPKLPAIDEAIGIGGGNMRTYVTCLRL